MPNDIFSNVLLLLLGYNYKKNLYVLCSHALSNEETEEIYNKFYNILKCKYSFNPAKFTFDFQKSNINACITNFK